MSEKTSSSSQTGLNFSDVGKDVGIGQNAAGGNITTHNDSALDILRNNQSVDFQEKLLEALLKDKDASAQAVLYVLKTEYEDFQREIMARMTTLERRQGETDIHLHGDPKWDYEGMTHRMKRLSTLIEKSIEENGKESSMRVQNTQLIQKIKIDTDENFTKLRGDFRWLLYGLVAFACVILYITLTA